MKFRDAFLADAGFISQIDGNLGEQGIGNLGKLTPALAFVGGW